MPELRQTQPGDFPALGRLLDGVFRHSKGVHDQSQLTDFPLVFAPDNCVNSRVLIEDGRIVSHAALWPRELVVEGHRLKAAAIVSVATDPAYRQRGYAAALMRSLHETLHAEHYELAILWTGVPDFYIKLGWEVVTPRGTIATLDTASARQLTTSPDADLKIDAFDPARHLEQIMALHDQEPVRFTRSCDEALALLTLPKVYVQVATHGGQVSAYTVHSDACNKRGLIEYGGSAEAVIPLVRRVAASLPAQTKLDWMIYGVRRDLSQLAESAGLACRRLTSSKSKGHEMIIRIKPVRISAEVLENIFVWGADWA